MAMNAVNDTMTSQETGQVNTAPVPEVKETQTHQENDNGEQSNLPLGTKISQSTVESTVKKMNDTMRSTRCEFSYHKETHRVSIKVLDKNTDEVLREIPPEKSLDMLEKMWEMAGILIDEKR